jgi:hypothetical protein
MTRTKWMRLGVRDPADILRWAGAQSTRQLDEFRYRLIRGREFVSFRMVPRYAIEIGTNDIVVVAYVKRGARDRLIANAVSFCRKATREIFAKLAALKPRAIAPLPSHTADLYQFAIARRSSTARR